MKASQTFHRQRLAVRLAARLARNGFPRIHMTLILLATGLASFLFSAITLHFGLDSMALRYPLAVLFGYLVFFVLLRVWIATHHDFNLDSGVTDLLDLPTGWGEMPGFIPNGSPSDNSFGWLDFLDGEGIVVGLILLIVVALASLAGLYLIYTAPALLGELLVDAVVLASVRKALLRNDAQHWSLGVLRRTGLVAAGLAAAFWIAGIVMEDRFPDAKSIGGVLAAKKEAAR